MNTISRIHLLVILTTALTTGCNRNNQTAVEPGAPLVKSTPRYNVTKEMQEELGDIIGKKAPNITGFLNTKYSSLDQLVKNNNTLVVVATKYECPCQIHAQPLFNDLCKKFESHGVKFIGVINTDKNLAEEYNTDYIKCSNNSYLMVPDKDCTILNAYQAKHSIYTYVINKEGTVVTAWPGYSKEMLQNLNHVLSQETGIEETPFDTKYAPKESTSGCVMEPHEEE